MAKLKAKKRERNGGQAARLASASCVSAPTAIEHRVMQVDQLQVREKRNEAGELEERKITGHAAVFNQLSEPIFGLFRERILPGAFKRAIDEKQDVRALVNHDSSRVLGRTKSGTLSLREDKTGLAVEISPPDTTYARDLVESIDRGDIDQMSFGFIAKDERWVEGGDEDTDLDIREIRDVDLFDVSPVAFPAYPQTDLALRSHERWKAEREARTTSVGVCEEGGMPLGLAEARQKQLEAENG